MNKCYLQYKLALPCVSADHVGPTELRQQQKSSLSFHLSLNVFESRIEVHWVIIRIHLGDFFIWWSSVQLLLLRWAAGRWTEDLERLILKHLLILQETTLLLFLLQFSSGLDTFKCLLLSLLLLLIFLRTKSFRIHSTVLKWSIALLAEFGWWKKVC